MITANARRLPRTVWALGLVSLCMDASSELVHSILPLYLTVSLGASMTTIGLIEGGAEAFAQIVKVFSGGFSDYFGKRKALVILGYGLAALSKPIFPLAGSVGWVFGARLLDRFGKGIRGAPRDALIADVTPPELRGAAYGLRQALDSVGAFIGPLLAIALLALFARDFKAVLWFATIPAVIAVLVLWTAVEEPPRSTPRAAQRLAWRDVQSLARPYWKVVLLGVVFTLARFSEAFLVLRGQHLGLGAAFAPAILVAMSVTYAVIAYPAGRAADHYPARVLLVPGLAGLVASDLLFAFANGPILVLSGAALWGIHLGLTQGLLSKLVAATAPPRLVGTAFGIFNLTCGLALFVASALAGWVWDAYGPAATFEVSALCAVISAAGVIFVRLK